MRTLTLILSVLMINFIQAQQAETLSQSSFGNGIEQPGLHHHNHNHLSPHQLMEDLLLTDELPNMHSADTGLLSRSAEFGLDSTYRYDTSGELFRIERYHKNVEGYPERIETFHRFSFINQPFDLAVYISEYQYDGAGRMINHISKQYDFDNHLPGEDYLTTSHTEYEFDAAGNQTFYSYKSIDWQSYQLVNRNRWYREYDLQHNQITYYLAQTGSQDLWINQRMDERALFEDGMLNMNSSRTANSQGEWVSGYRYDYLGYQNSLYTALIHQEWSYENQDWKNYRKFEAEFDSNDLYTVIKGFEWEKGNRNWWHFQNAHYEYNNQQLHSNILYEIRESLSAPWINDRNYIYDYNATGRMIEYIFQTWEGTQKSWFNVLKYTWQYDDEDRQIFFSSNNWSQDEQDWIGTYRSFREWYAANLPLYIKAENFSTEFNTWHGSVEHIYEYNNFEQRTFYQYLSNQNPETMFWQSGVKWTDDYDSYGYTSSRSWYNFDVDTQEFLWSYTNEYIHDYYENRKRTKYMTPWMKSAYELTVGYVTYQVDLQISSQGNSLEGATFTVNGQAYSSGSNGMISFSMVLDTTMTFNYTLEKEGYNSRQGTMTIDRNINESFVMIPTGSQTYEVKFVVKHGNDLIENASVNFTGYGTINTNQMGEALFEEVAPENNIAYTVTYGNLKYENELSVTDQDVALEINLEGLGVASLFARKIRLYPNPANNYLMVDAENGGNVTIEIRNINASLVLTRDDNSRLIKLDIRDLKPGLYFVRTMSGDSVSVEKLLVQ